MSPVAALGRLAEPGMEAFGAVPTEQRRGREQVQEELYWEILAIINRGYTGRWRRGAGGWRHAVLPWGLEPPPPL